ncbi:45 kDa antigen [Taenia solium]|eukprot:TsM_001089600 transcript=TsM_001089600 gene=TsM_001089600
MASYLCSILLAAFVLALDYGATIRTVASVQILRNQFTFAPVLSTSILVSWNKYAFHDVLDEYLTVTAVLASNPESKVTASAKFSKGYVSLYNLTSNSTYIVTLTANLGGNTAMVLRKSVKTKAYNHYLPQDYFYLGPVTNQSIRLSWDHPDRMDTFNKIITLTAELASNPRVEHSESARIGAEQVTVDGLTPGTLYKVTVTGTQDGRKILQFSKYIQTLDTGHEEVTVVTTSGSAAACTIVGLLFTCMATVLA